MDTGCRKSILDIYNNPIIRPFRLVLLGKVDKGLKDYIAYKLRQLREKKSLTQLGVYNETGILVSRIEGRRVNITVNQLKTLCDLYGSTLTDFFKDFDNMPTKN